MARRIHEKLTARLGAAPAFGSLDINLYRDDWTTREVQPQVGPSEIAFSLAEKNVILVDDVLFAGRSVRAALDALRDQGRPAVVQLAVLVDRGHRELPVRADYVGKNVPTARGESVHVRLAEHDDRDSVVISR